MSNRNKAVYLAKLAEKAERYDEMADHMVLVAQFPDELSVEERNLLSVAHKNAVGSRRAAWRTITGVNKKEQARGKEEEATCARGYCVKVEAELQQICDAVLALLDGNLINSSSNSESKVFYQKMKADYIRYIAEISDDAQKSQLIEQTHMAYKEAQTQAERSLSVNHPIRLGLALNFSVFTYEILQDHEEACKIARIAFEDAIAELDNISEEYYKDSTLIMQLLRDNLVLWTSEQEEGVGVTEPVIESSASHSRDQSPPISDRGRELFLAKLAEQAERYDDMAAHMESVVRFPDELSVEDGHLFYIACKNAVSSRRAAWSIISNAVKAESANGNEENAHYAKDYRTSVEAELQQICNRVLVLVDGNLLKNASSSETLLFYQKMKGDFYRYIAEVANDGEQKSQASKQACLAYETARSQAGNDLAVTHPMRLGLALSWSVFSYEVLQDRDNAIKIAQTAFEDAVEGLDDLDEASYKDATLTMNLLREKFTSWTSDTEVGEGRANVIETA